MQVSQETQEAYRELTVLQNPRLDHVEDFSQSFIMIPMIKHVSSLLMEAVTEMETDTMMKQRVRPPVEVSNEQVCATWLCNFF